MKQVKNCPICHSDKNKVFLKAKPSIFSGSLTPEQYACTTYDHSFQTDILECRECHHIFASMVPEEADFAMLYGNVVDETYVKEAPIRQRTFHHYLMHMLKHAKRAFGGDISNKAILEVGSYYGGFLDESRKAGIPIVGIEPCNDAVSFCRNNGHTVYNGIFESWTNPDNLSFDVIALWDVFEHIGDPNKFLARAYELLKPGGVLCFSTMDVKALVPRLMGRHWPWFMTMHVNYYSKKSLRNVLARNGFTLTHTHYHPHYVSVRYICHKLAIMYRPTRWLWKWIGSKRQINDRVIPFNAFDNMFIVAIK